MLNQSSSAGQPRNAGAGAGDSLLKELFIESLQDVYYAEKALTKAMPRMQAAATSPELINAFETHLQQTQGQIQRLDKQRRLR